MAHITIVIKVRVHIRILLAYLHLTLADSKNGKMCGYVRDFEYE